VLGGINIFTFIPSISSCKIDPLTDITKQGSYYYSHLMAS